MDKQSAENIITGCLEIIRLVCAEAYGDDFDHCSMYVTPDSKSATMINENGYLLNYHWMKEENEDGTDT